MGKLLKQAWHSLFRDSWPESDEGRSRAVVNNFFLHIQPVKTRRHGLNFWYTMGLGGVLFLLLVLLTVTGFLLMFYYTPFPEVAYRSMKDLATIIPFGKFLRNLHRWAAHAMVFLVFVHMCRVFYTAAYKSPREFNWVIGVSLLLLTLGLSFTGYLLPWDQLAYWAVTVGMSIVSYVPLVGEKLRFLFQGASTIGEGTLLRFYVLHCFVLPIIMGVLCGVHFWRIRKDGGLSGPPLKKEPARVEARAGSFPASSKTYGLMALVKPSGPIFPRDPDDTVFTWPHLIYRELLMAVSVTFILCVFSIVFNAPLESPADPTTTPNPAKAPWYFLGLQELVHYDALWGGVIAPAVVVLFLFALPYIDRNPKGVGVWFSRDRKFLIALFTFFLVVAVVLTVIGTFFRGPNWSFVLPWSQ